MQYFCRNYRCWINPLVLPTLLMVFCIGVSSAPQETQPKADRGLSVLVKVVLRMAK